MNLQTIKLNMLNDLKGIERDEITKEQVETALKANFFETLMKSEDEQTMAEWFQALGQNGDIHSNPIGTIRVGFFEVSFHENYVDPGSVDYVYTYEIRQTEWNGIN
jgi:hypothetical protein